MASSSSEYVGVLEFNEPSAVSGRESQGVPESPCESETDSVRHYVSQRGVLKHPPSTSDEDSLSSLRSSSLDEGSIQSTSIQSIVKEEVEKANRENKTKIHDLEERVKENSKAMKEVEGKLEKKNKELEEKDEQIENLKSELEREKQEKQRMGVELQQKESIIRDLEHERSQLNEEIQSLRKDVTQLKGEMQNIQNQNSALQSTVDQMQKRMERSFQNEKPKSVKEELEEVLHQYKGELALEITKKMQDQAISAVTTSVTSATDKVMDYKSNNVARSNGGSSPGGSDLPIQSDNSDYEQQAISDTNNETVYD